ncbi:hypothetical protein [Lysobacter tyrosinilyticus]
MRAPTRKLNANFSEPRCASLHRISNDPHRVGLALLRSAHRHSNAFIARTNDGSPRLNSDWHDDIASYHAARMLMRPKDLEAGAQSAEV